jgi:hypothetical protein
LLIGNSEITKNFPDKEFLCKEIPKIIFGRLINIEKGLTFVEKKRTGRLKKVELIKSAPKLTKPDKARITAFYLESFVPSLGLLW